MTSHYVNQWWLVYWRIYASLGLNELIIVAQQWRQTNFQKCHFVLNFLACSSHGAQYVPVKYEVKFLLCHILVRHARWSEECFSFLQISSAIWKLFATQQIKCFPLVTLWMPYNCQIGIYDINKSTKMSQWVVTSMQIWTKCLNQSGFEIEMIFQYCGATFIDTKLRQALYGPLQIISMFWIAIPRFLCFINFICIS